MMDMEPVRRLAWESCYNVRDLGGYETTDGRRIRWGQFLRADDLCRLSPQGCAALIAYGVHTVIDLRSPSELALAPHPFAVGDPGAPAYHALSLFDEEDRAAMEAIDKISNNGAFYCAVLDVFTRRVGAVVQAVADAPEGGVLVHCFAGKDRTGMVSALLLALAGIPHEVIAADYALSDSYLQPLYAELLAAVDDPVERERRAREYMALPESMLAVLDHLDTRYGGISAYLRAAGVTDGQMEQIRQRLLEPRDQPPFGGAVGAAEPRDQSPWVGGEGYSSLSRAQGEGQGVRAIVRPAVPADAAAMARVHVDSWRTTYRGILPDASLDRLCYAEREQMWTRLLGRLDGAQCAYVASDDGNEIVGLASGGPERSNDPLYGGELYAIYLLQSSQGRGLGRLLAATVAAHLARHGLRAMLVWVAARNPACHFYAALGGTPLRRKHETIGGAAIEEVAYGWLDTQTLTQTLTQER